MWRHRLVVAACLATGAFAEPTVPVPESQAATSSEGYIVTSDSARLFFRVVGRGSDVVVVVHGGPGGDMEGLVPDLSRLASGHRVVFYDQRGGGRSELPQDKTRLVADRQIKDLNEVRLHFGAERIAIVAHSYGPLLAASYALAYPQTVSRMVFLGGLPPRKGDVWARMDATLAGRLSATERARAADAEKRMADRSADIRRACRDYWSVMLRPRLAEPDRILKDRQIDLCVSEPEALWYGWNVAFSVVDESFGDWDLRSRLRQLDIPTLVIHGELDAIPIDMVAEWSTSMPRATLLKVPRAAHFPYLERPDIVWPAIDRFLAQRLPNPQMEPTRR